MSDTRDPLFLEGGPSTAARFPRMWAQAQASVAAAAAGRPLACKHVIDGGPVTLCAEHPGAGFMCWSCGDRHGRRHTDEVEYSCNECGALVADDLMIGGAVWPAPAGLDVRDTRGRHRRLVDNLLVVTLGVCCECARGEPR